MASIEIIAAAGILVAIVACVTSVILALRLTALRRHLVQAQAGLQDAAASEVLAQRAHRATVRHDKASTSALRDSVALRKEGDENLRIAVESGLETDETLRVAVEQGLIGDEKLRQSVAAGVKGAEALRISVAKGVKGEEALRISIEQGSDAATTTLAVVDTVDAAITLYDPDGSVLLTNDTARALAILAESQRLDPLEFEQDRITPIPRFDQVQARAARGQLVTRRAYWVGTGDSQRAMMSTSQYVKRASGELIGTVVASHDVTPLARTRDEFLQTVSHELRTPLTSIVGYLEVIEDTLNLDSAGIEQEFGIVQRNTQRLLKLINDLLLTATKEMSTDRRPLNLADIVTDSYSAASAAARSAGVTLTLAEMSPVDAEIDADRVREVFDEILSNALKFSRRGGEISIGLSIDETDAIVEFADTGIGISQDDVKRIFERFFRSDETRAEVIAGAGLGLSASKLIVDAHGGTITATSVHGEGTTVTVRLPRSVGSA
jgi:signal transduction histidine kinase